MRSRKKHLSQEEIEKYYTLLRAISENDINTVKMLVHGGLDLNTQIWCNDYLNYWDAISMAIRYNKIEMLCLLINYGVNINSKDFNKVTPLMKAIRFEHFDCAKLLLAANAKYGIRDRWGRNALAYAKEARNPEIIGLINKARAERQIKITAIKRG